MARIWLDYSAIESENVFSVGLMTSRTVLRILKESDMLQLHDGQCGLCVHFGDEHPEESKLVKIRTTH
jgi:hypothetical protein